MVYGKGETDCVESERVSEAIMTRDPCSGIVEVLTNDTVANIQSGNLSTLPKILHPLLARRFALPLESRSPYKATSTMR